MLCPGSLQEAGIISAALGREIEPGDAQADWFLKFTPGIGAQQVTGRTFG